MKSLGDILQNKGHPTGEETADKEQENEIQEGFSNFKVIFQICFDM